MGDAGALNRRIGRRLGSLALLAALGLIPALPAAAQSPCVVELFTSQGCSSCPKADALLARMSEAGDVTVLSMPVDYWDYIGWKDTLALPVFAKRQKAYANARGDSHIYTPQAVINGQTHVIGSKEADIRAACVATGPQRGPSVSFTPAGDGTARIRIGAAPDGGLRSGMVWLMQVASKRTVEVTRGENAGRTLTYTNVVRGIVRLGEWSGEPIEFSATLEQIRDPEFDRTLLVVQAGAYRTPGPILTSARGP